MTVSALHFREAVEADIPAMLEIRLAVRENRLPDPSWLTRQMWLDSLVDAGKANCHVCELDGQVIGFSIGRLAEADIWALFVAPDREGLGAGKQLLRMIADWMFANGVQEIELGTGVDTRADAFYSRQGWRRDAALSAKGERVYRLRRADALRDNLATAGAGMSIVDEGLRLRAATASDAALIHDLILQLADYERLRDDVIATADDVSRALFGDAPRAFCEIAEWDGAPVGFALWFYNYSTFRGRHGIYLEDLFVRPEARGRGIGKALITRLARRCADEGLHRLQWTVLDWNAPAIEFYESLGAQLDRDWVGCRLHGDPLATLAATAADGAAT